MQDFDSLKEMWKKPAATSDVAAGTFNISKASVSAKKTLMKHQKIGAIVLIFTGILIALMAAFGNFQFKHFYTYGAMILITLICFGQAAILYYTYNKIKQIDDAAPPPQHLKQWEDYYSFRQRQITVNTPLYFIFLNLAMGLYLWEVLSGRPIVNVTIFLVTYTAWMLFAIFYLGKKNVRKERQKLQTIMDELRLVKDQFEKA